MTAPIRIRRRPSPPDMAPERVEAKTATPVEARGPSRPSTAVGYGKPPAERQFVPGKSGNPKGRPRGSRNIATLIAQQLARPVNISEGGRSRTVSASQAIALRLVAKALGGDLKSIVEVLKVQSTTAANSPTAVTEAPLSADEQALLDSLLANLGISGAGDRP